MIRLDPEYGGHAYTKGFWPWRRIFVGHSFVLLPDREQQAVLLHEVGHRVLWHIERRLLHRLIFGVCTDYLQRQELEADAYVARRGYGADLAKVLRRIDGSDQAFRDKRIARLEEAVKSGLANGKNAV